MLHVQVSSIVHFEEGKEFLDNTFQYAVNTGTAVFLQQCEQAALTAILKNVWEIKWLSN